MVCFPVGWDQHALVSQCSARSAVEAISYFVPHSVCGARLTPTISGGFYYGPSSQLFSCIWSTPKSQKRAVDLHRPWSSWKQELAIDVRRPTRPRKSSAVPHCSPWICQTAARVSTWQLSFTVLITTVPAVPAVPAMAICQSRVSQLSEDASSPGRYAGLMARLDEAHVGLEARGARQRGVAG